MFEWSRVGVARVDVGHARAGYVRQRRKGKSSVRRKWKAEGRMEVAGKHNRVVPSADIVRTGE